MIFWGEMERGGWMFREISLGGRWYSFFEGIVILLLLF